MAITLPTVLTEGNSTVAATTRATGTFTMPSSGLVLACWSISAPTTLSNPSLTDNVGGTWATYTDGTDNATAILPATLSRAKIFRCTVKGSGTATLTLDCGANTHDVWTWHILHFPDCLDQNAVNLLAATGTSNALLSTLAAMQGTSGTFGFGVCSGGVMTVGAGFTISGTAQSPVGLRSLAEAQTGTDTTVDMSTTSSPAWVMVGVELEPTGGVVVGTSTRLRSARRRR